MSDRRTTAYEFMSPGWVEMAREEITHALSTADLADEQFTLCEEFTDPPDHLRRGDAETIGFYVRLVGGQTEIGDDCRITADCRIISDYGDALTVARDPDAPAANPTEVQRRIAEGTLKIEGDSSRMPKALQHLDIHRLLAAHTL
jgi:hypothetical protein